MKKKTPILIAIVLIILLCGGFAFSILYEKYSYSKERADLDEYFGLSGEDSVAIVLQDELLEDKALLRDGVYYLNLDTVHKFLNNRFYLDNSVESEALLIYTTTDTSYRTLQDSKTITSEKGQENSDFVLMLYENDTCYVAIDYVVRFTDMTYQVFTQPNRMQIYNEWPKKTVAEVKKNTQVRYRGGVKSEILTDVKKGANVTVLEELDSWYKVKTEDAYIGYVQKRFVKNVQQCVVDRAVLVEETYYPAVERDKRINMGWHQVFSTAANDNISSLVSGTNLNVIAPTWFFLNGDTGEYVCNATQNYVNYAHGKGIDVWAVVDNINMKCNLHEVLKSTAQRDNLITNLVVDCKRFGIDGLNVDFEQVSPETGRHYIQFIRELSVACHANNLILSVDNYVPTAYTAFYDREEQGRYADYVIIMGYDEHAGNSDVAGSVASLGFVRQGIEDTLSEVEKAKVINGVPFYTRGWATTDGKVSVKTYTMSTQTQFLKDHGIEIKWDESLGQFYGSSHVNGATYEIWMEEASSLREKLKVMKEYDIAGVAQWKLGLETDDVWTVIGEYINE